MENIAIIGLGCRFPKAANPQAYWQLLTNGIDAITEVPTDRWNVDELYDPQPATPGKMNTRWGGFLEQVDGFDPLFFNISPREAERIDPQQRLFLEVAWSALENAGLATDKLAGSLTGVFAGMAVVNYDQLLYKNVADLTQISAYDGIGTTLSLASSRLSYLLDLKGPSLAIETACSSSLVAVHLACQSLRSRESNLCIVGGVNLILTPELNIVFSQARMMSPDGRCKTFDADANGYVRGEGCGVVVLKRLCDAMEAGDNIQAVIRGSAVNQDGASNGITAPNGPSQQAVIRQALNNAGVKPADISYVEAHGTGTPLGDPIEVKSLKSVLMEDRRADQPCWLGSVKTNIGHLEAAAGMAGLIKVVLALQHQEIPPNLHLNKLNPYIRLHKTPLSIPTANRSWTVEQETRLAGISSFGFGGTNAHVILEQAPVVKPVKAKKERSLQLLTLSARNEAALVELAGKYSEFLNSNPAVSLADICFTANAGRTHFEYRLVAISSSLTQLQTSLQAFASGEDSATVATGYLSTRSRPQVAFLFTGQGSQYMCMGKELYQTQPTFRKALDYCADILTSYLDRPLQEIIYSSLSLIDQTKYTQPAIFAIEYALAQLWQSWGIQPSVVMGHSVGEYVAACVAGVFSLADGLKLIAERGRLMQSLPQNGSMVSLLAEPEIVLAAIEPSKRDVAIAAYNGAKNTVISGKTAAIQNIVSQLESQGIKTKYLQVSHGFHSPLMQPILADFARVAKEITYSSPQITLISNVTGEIATANIATPEYWCNHIMQPVQFARGMATLEAQKPTILLEIGAKPILLGMGHLCLSDTANYAFIPSLRPQKSDWQQLLESLGELFLRGIAIDWSGFERDYLPRRRLELPTYPFQRQRYWVKANQTHPISFVDSQPTSLLSLLSQGKLEQVKNQLETTAALSTAEIELLPKLLNLLIDQRQPETHALKSTQISNCTTKITVDEIAKTENWEQKREQLLKANPKERKELLKLDFAQLLSKVMKIKPSDLDWQQRLSSLGMDSLMATELRRHIETQFKIYIPVEFLAELNLEQFLTQLLCLIEGQSNHPLDALSDKDLLRTPNPKNQLTTTPIASSDKWIIRPEPNPQARSRLFCFPYAGGGTSIFNNWSDRLYPEVEVCLIQLPGRENRLQESPLTRLKLLIQTLTPIIKPYLDLPFTLFGHSLGAWLSFELIRELRRQNSPLPTHLFVSGSKAPQLPDLIPPIHRLPDEKFIAKIKSFKGTPEAVLQDTQLMKRFLPALRADFAILETYFYAEETPLNCPITAFGGWEDSQVNQEELSAWKQQTEAEFTLKMFAGEHFFLHSAHSDLLEAIATQLERHFLIFN
ncbi:MAG: beta-ketoacyl synthase N-terminal-like domain-containing protein [Pleurocapsa sp.]